MFLHQAVEERLVGGTPHLFELKWLEIPQPVFDRHLVYLDQGRAASMRQRIMPSVTHWRQRDLTGPFQHQQHAPAHHVA